MSIEQRLREVRPKLRDAAPLIHKIVWGFGLFNIWIGFSLFLASSHSLQHVSIVNNIFTLKMWSVVFWALAAGILWGVIKNSWSAIRFWMSVAVFIKAIWFYALLELAIRNDFANQMGVLGLWFFAAYIQVVAVVYFIPPKTTPKILNGGGDGK